MPLKRPHAFRPDKPIRWRWYEERLFAKAPPTLDQCLTIAVDRVRYFHEQSDYALLSPRPLVPCTGATVQEVQGIERQLAVPLPNEYREFLRRWRYLDVYDGYRIWGLKNFNDEDPRVDNLPEDFGGRLLVCGDYWYFADGDVLSISLDHAETPVVVSLHDHGIVTPLAPTLSLALWRIVEEVLPVDKLDVMIQDMQAYVRKHLAKG